MTGLMPVAEIQFNDFLACAMDQLCNQAAKLRFMMGGQVSIPMVVRAPTAPPGGGPAQPVAGSLVHAHAGAQGGDALDPL